MYTHTYIHVIYYNAICYDVIYRAACLAQIGTVLTQLVKQIS